MSDEQDSEANTTFGYSYSEADRLLSAFKCEPGEQTFSEFAYHMQGRIYGYLKWFLKHTQDAEDATHETLLTVFSKIDYYDSGRPAWPWIRAIARNIALKIQSKRAKVGQLTELMQELIVDKRQDEFTLDEKQVGPLGRCLEQLSDAERVPFLFHILDGLSHERIAERLGRTLDASKSAVYRAKSNLRKCLEKSEQNDRKQSDRKQGSNR